MFFKINLLKMIFLWVLGITAVSSHGSELLQRYRHSALPSMAEAQKSLNTHLPARSFDFFGFLGSGSSLVIPTNSFLNSLHWFTSSLKFKVLYLFQQHSAKVLPAKSVSYFNNFGFDFDTMVRADLSSARKLGRTHEELLFETFLKRNQKILENLVNLNASGPSDAEREEIRRLIIEFWKLLFFKIGNFSGLSMDLLRGESTQKEKFVSVPLPSPLLQAPLGSSVTKVVSQEGALSEAASGAASKAGAGDVNEEIASDEEFETVKKQSKKSKEKRSKKKAAQPATSRAHDQRVYLEIGRKLKRNSPKLTPVELETQTRRRFNAVTYINRMSSAAFAYNSVSDDSYELPDSWSLTDMYQGQKVGFINDHEEFEVLPKSDRVVYKVSKENLEAALEDTLESKQVIIDCGGFVSLALFKGFGSEGPSSEDIYVAPLNAVIEANEDSDEDYVPCSSFYSLTEEVPLDEFTGSLDESLKELIPGDLVYFTNYGDYTGDYWAGEWTMYVGENDESEPLFFGHGLGAKTYEEIIEQIEEAYRDLSATQGFTAPDAPTLHDAVPGISQVFRPIVARDATERHETIEEATKRSRDAAKQKYDAAKEKKKKAKKVKAKKK